MSGPARARAAPASKACKTNPSMATESACSSSRLRGASLLLLLRRTSDRISNDRIAVVTGEVSAGQRQSLLGNRVLQRLFGHRFDGGGLGLAARLYRDHAGRFISIEVNRRSWRGVIG